jgi:predicted RNase H-like HicB family nuclease
MDIPIKVVIHRDDDGGFWAEVPGLPGCATEGQTMEVLRRNLREAIEGCFGATQDEALREEECEPGEVVTL